MANELAGEASVGELRAAVVELDRQLQACHSRASDAMQLVRFLTARIRRLETRLEALQGTADKARHSVVP